MQVIPTIDYHAVLADLHRRQGELQGAVSAIQRILGVEATMNRRVALPSAVPEAESLSAPSTIQTKDKPSRFNGMSTWRAAESFLRLEGGPRTTRQILTGLLEGGFQTTAKHFDANLFNVLTLKSQVFARVDKGVWGLTEWRATRGRNR